MSMGTLTMAAESVGGRLHGADRGFERVSTDTRTLAAGDLFIALRGPNFDAAQFIAEAERLGAAGAVVERLQQSGLAQVEVSDTRCALGDLARAWRARFELPLIAVTGSNGKTTVKELLAAILRAEAGDDAAVLATSGNLNNDIGLPLMTLRLRASHRFAVLEMGASHAGEIDYLAGIAQPVVGVVNNAGSAHLEGFGSVDGVARAKGELFAALSADGTAVINRDDQYYDYWHEVCGARRMISFGLSADADFRASELVEKSGDAGSLWQFNLHSPVGNARIELPMAGRHNIRNALAAAAAAVAAGASLAAVERGLRQAANVGGRLRRVAALSGAVLFDDSYNANPGSVLAAIEFLASQPGERWLVLGDMAELGKDSERMHRQIGEAAQSAGITRFACTGDAMRAAAGSFGNTAEWYADVQSLIVALQEGLHPGVVMLVKASRSMGLDRVVSALRAGSTG